MQHTKFQGHRPFGSTEQDLNGFTIIWAWRPTWSCDINHLNPNSFTHPMKASHEICLQLALRFIIGYNPYTRSVPNIRGLPSKLTLLLLDLHEI